MAKTDLNHLTSQIIKAAIFVHKDLGPGLLESVYARCMAVELRRMGHGVEVEVPVPIMFRGESILDEGFRMDLLVDGSVVVELKSCEQVKAVHKKQLLTYLRLSGKKVGLLINFNVALLREGITRIVNGFEEAGCPDPGSSPHQEDR